MGKEGAPQPRVFKVSDAELSRIPAQLTNFSVKVVYIDILFHYSTYLGHGDISSKNVRVEMSLASSLGPFSIPYRHTHHIHIHPHHIHIHTTYTHTIHIYTHTTHVIHTHSIYKPHTYTLIKNLNKLLENKGKKGDGAVSSKSPLNNGASEATIGQLSWEANPTLGCVLSFCYHLSLSLLLVLVSSF